MALILIAVGLWLSIGGYLPFILAGQPPDSDGLRGAAFGLIFLVVAVSVWLSSQGWWKMATVAFLAICGFWIIAGFSAYQQEIRISPQEDLLLRNLAISLKEQIPDVPERTNFIFVNSGLGRTGCIGFVNMLYDRSTLHCIHLLSGDTQESYTRTDGGLLETGGRLWSERFIILSFDEQGKVTLLDQIADDDFSGLPLTWESKEPIVTNRYLIYSSIGGDPSLDFYNYMLNQKNSQN